MIKALHSYAFGIGTKNSNGEIIEVFYPKPQVEVNELETKRLLEISSLKSAGFIELSERQAGQIRESFKEGLFENQASIFDGVSAADTSILAHRCLSFFLGSGVLAGSLGSPPPIQFLTGVAVWFL